MPLIIGNHVSKEGMHMHDAIKRDVAAAATYGATLNACQIFAIGPRNAKVNLSADDIAKLKVIAQNMKIFVHASYMTNPFNGTKPEFGIITARRELELCDQFDGAGVIIHLARVGPTDIASVVVKILAGKPDPAGNMVTTKSMLWLEIESYAATSVTYETAAKCTALLAVLAAVLSPADMSRIGICIDTAHLWAAGTDVASADAADAYMKAMHELGCPLMMHLNDQIYSLGSGRDEHAALMYGTIWATYREDKIKSGLFKILEYAVRESMPIILERKEDKPKVNGLPVGSNLMSDYMIVTELAKDTE